MTSLQEDRETAAKEVEHAGDAKTFYQFFRRHPELNSMANENLIRGYLNNDPVTDHNLEEAVAFLGARLAIKTQNHIKDDQNAEAEDIVEAEQNERAALEASILGCFKGPGAKEIQNAERAKFKYKDLTELKARLVELLERRRCAALSPEELRAFVRSGRPEAASEPVVLPWSRAEIIKWTASEHKQHCMIPPDYRTYRTGYEIALNKILAKSER